MTSIREGVEVFDVEDANGDIVEAVYLSQAECWLAEHDREVRAAALAPIKTLAEKIMFDQDAEPARGAILAEIERQTSDDVLLDRSPHGDD